MPTRGPLPSANPRRRNKPTIPSDNLPASGRDGSPPEPIEALDELERRYFDWAWTTPAAGAWHESDAEIVAEWARLKAYASRCLRGEIMKTTATGLVIPEPLSTSVLAQITAREDRLFLSPGGRKSGRTVIVDDEAPVSSRSGNVVTPDRWKRSG